jgi:hypothetical protein
MIQAARFPVTLTSRVDERQVSRFSLLDKSFLDGRRQFLGVAATDEAAGGYGCTIGNQLHRLGGA